MKRIEPNTAKKYGKGYPTKVGHQIKRDYYLINFIIQINYYESDYMLRALHTYWLTFPKKLLLLKTLI